MTLGVIFYHASGEGGFARTSRTRWPQLPSLRQELLSTESPDYSGKEKPCHQWLRVSPASWFLNDRAGAAVCCSAHQLEYASPAILSGSRSIAKSSLRLRNHPIS